MFAVCDQTLLPCWLETVTVSQTVTVRAPVAETEAKGVPARQIKTKAIPVEYISILGKLQQLLADPERRWAAHLPISRAHGCFPGVICD